MNGQRWLTVLVAASAVLLLVYGVFYVLIIDFARTMEAGPNGQWPTAEFVALVQSDLPAYYVIASEGILFGTVAAVSAIAMGTSRSWAQKLLLVSSILLALVAAAAIAMLPREWDIQGVLILLCMLFWWEARRAARRKR